MSLSVETFSKSFPGLVSSLEPGELKALLAALRPHDADAGEALVAEGTQSSELFLVLDGRLDVTMAGSDGGQHLAGVAPGSYFGEVSLLDPDKSGASVTTEQGCATLRLSRERFDTLCVAEPGAAAALLGEVLRSLSARGRAATARAQDAA